MRLVKKLGEFLMTEASVKLTPLAKSSIRLQDVWTKDELDTIVDNLIKNVKGSMKYEVSLDRKTGKLSIYRKGDDVMKGKMSKDEIKTFLGEIGALVKGTGLKIVGDAKSADWISAIVSK